MARIYLAKIKEETFLLHFWEGFRGPTSQTPHRPGNKSFTKGLWRDGIMPHPFLRPFISLGKWVGIAGGQTNHQLGASNQTLSEGLVELWNLWWYFLTLFLVGNKNKKYTDVWCQVGKCLGITNVKKILHISVCCRLDFWMYQSQVIFATTSEKPPWNPKWHPFEISIKFSSLPFSAICLSWTSWENRCASPPTSVGIPSNSGLFCWWSSVIRICNHKITWDV